MSKQAQSTTSIEIDEAKMLEEIRKILALSIEDFVYQMNWPNAKYYDYIKNGRKRPGSKLKQVAHPTIKKVFVGINYALQNYENWKTEEKKIIQIVNQFLFL